MVCSSIDVGKLREISTRNLEADVSVIKSSRSFSPKDLNVARSHGNETRQLCRFIKWLTLLFLVLDFTSISLFQPANITRDACTIKIRSTDPHLRSLSLSTAPAQPIDCSVFSSSFVVLSLSRTLRVFVPLKSYTTSLFNETQRQFAKRLRRSEFSSTPRSQKGRVAS